MPKLGRYSWIPRIVFFLYSNVEDARAGKRAGGTGFLVTVPSEEWPDRLHHVYGVTNWHNLQHGASVVRVNKIDQEPDIFDFDPAEWHFVPGPDGYDIAVTALDVLNPKVHNVEALQLCSFMLTRKKIDELEIGPGDDVFMVGRFIDADKVEFNQPSLRFGHISIMELQVRQPNGCTRPSHIIDMHSRTGYSGSPVFVYRTPGSIFPNTETLIVKGHTFLLLGVHWGQFPERWEIVTKSDKDLAWGSSNASISGSFIEGLSGMTCLCPSYAIWEVLQTADLKETRKKREQNIRGPIG